MRNLFYFPLTLFLRVGRFTGRLSTRLFFEEGELYLQSFYPKIVLLTLLRLFKVWCVKPARIRVLSDPYVLVIARHRVQYGKYFPSFSNFAIYLKYLRNNSKIRETRKIFANIVRGQSAISSLSLIWKYITTGKRNNTKHRMLTIFLDEMWHAVHSNMF